MNRIFISFIMLSVSFLISCGKQTEQGQLKIYDSNIVGGANTSKYKTSVALIDNMGNLTCSGFIIDKKTIGTAAHCLSGYYYDLADSVFVGSSINGDGIQKGKVYKIDYVRFVAEYGEYYDDLATVQFPKFPTDSGEDFGYVVLEEELDIDESEIVPIMTEQDVEQYLRPGAEVIAVGFGFTSLERADVTQLGTKRVVEFDVIELYSDVFTAGDYGVKDTSGGDSGGALYHKDSQGNLSIVGITSMSIPAGCSEELGIGDVGIGAYGRADQAMKWIESDRIVHSIKWNMSVNQKIELLQKAVKAYSYNREAIKVLVSLYLQQGNIDAAWELIMAKPDGINAAISTDSQMIWNELVEKIVEKRDIDSMEKYCQEIIDLNNGHQKTLPFEPPYETIFRLFLKKSIDADIFTDVAVACFDNSYDHWSKIMNRVLQIKDREQLLETARDLFKAFPNVQHWKDYDRRESLAHFIAQMADEDLAIDLAQLAFKYVFNLRSTLDVPCKVYHRERFYYKRPVQIAKLKGHRRLARLFKREL